VAHIRQRDVQYDSKCHLSDYELYVMALSVIYQTTSCTLWL